MSLLDNVKKVYFIGIGGSSMSSLAEILMHRGYTVSGSDMQSSAMTDKLSADGIKVYVGHSAENVAQQQPDIIVRTDAIALTNPEVVYAQAHSIPVYRRAELLGTLLDGYEMTVGVAGTHGKTTTSSMITSVFLEKHPDVSAIIGGKMKRIDSSYKIGSDKYCVFESCEFRESFLYFHSDISVILNIAEDHMEYFKTLDNLINSFRKYLFNTKPCGTVVYNAEDENSLRMIDGWTGKKVSYGVKKGDVHAENLNDENGVYCFDCVAFGKPLAHIKLSVPGAHNVKNALATAAACLCAGISAEEISAGIEHYTGAGRRFEYHCTVNGAVIADDYGHHPDAYKVTFDTARDLGFKRIIAIHQPHTFSRTKMLMNEFVEVLSTVDKVLIPPIYAARETNDEYNIYAEDIVKRLPNAEYMEDFEHIAHRVKEIAQPGDLFITLGCGDIYKAAELITKLYGEKKFL